jgi:hypothetical protein
MPLHYTLQKLRRSPATPSCGHKNFKYFALVIDGTPEVVRLAINSDKYFVQVPALVRARMMMNSMPADLGGKQRTDPVPPEPHRLVADIDTALKQQVLDLAQQ